MARPSELPVALQGTDRSRPVGGVVRPAAGWLRSIREALGLSLADQARKLKVTPPAIRAFEQAEAEDRITLASLRRTAAAMDCDLVYTLVPKSGTLPVPTKGAAAAPRTPASAAAPKPKPAAEPPASRDVVLDLSHNAEHGVD